MFAMRFVLRGACLLVLALLVGLTGCGGKPKPAEMYPDEAGTGQPKKDR